MAMSPKRLVRSWPFEVPVGGAAVVSGSVVIGVGDWGQFLLQTQ